MWKPKAQVSLKMRKGDFNNPSGAKSSATPAIPNWTNAAIREGLEDIEQGRYTTLSSPQEIEDFLRQLREEVLAEADSVALSQR